MSRKRYPPEQIIGKLREGELALAPPEVKFYKLIECTKQKSYVC